MTLFAIAVTAAILGLGAVFQSAVGFGMALVAIPLLVLAGQSLPSAIALVLGAGAVQTAYGSYVARDQIRWRYAVSLAAIQWGTLIVGVACMSLVVEGDPDVVRRSVGGVLLIVVTAQLLLRPEPRERLARGWAGLAAGSAGFLAGLVGMGGPPLVLFAMAHRWDRDTFRAFLWSQILLVLPVLGAVLAFRFGTSILVWIAVGVAMAPIVWAGTRVGLAVTRRWERRGIVVAATITLYAIGLAGLLGR